MRLFYLINGWAGRNDFADATLRLFYVSAVPLLATALAALLIFLPRHPWRVTGRFSHREVPSGRIVLATAFAVAACALLMSAVNSGSLRFLNAEILSPRPFVTHRGVLQAQPIKGTARRGATQSEDEYSKEALRNSVKDRAENVMIVDLLRNDLGRVCKWGSVRVPQLFEVQSFPTLHHLVSSVSGELRAECDGVDAMRACFPCGSITGAPKIRAMQIIDELEPARRGAAMGAIGYFGFNGDMDWNVAIRTVTCKNNTAYFHVGGGIVADSAAQDEYSEMLLKAQALRAALSSASLTS